MNVERKTTYFQHLITLENIAGFSKFWNSHLMLKTIRVFHEVLSAIAIQSKEVGILTSLRSVEKLFQLMPLDELDEVGLVVLDTADPGVIPYTIECYRTPDPERKTLREAYIQKHHAFTGKPRNEILDHMVAVETEKFEINSITEDAEEYDEPDEKLDITETFKGKMTLLSQKVVMDVNSGLLFRKVMACDNVFEFERVMHHAVKARVHMFTTMAKTQSERVRAANQKFDRDNIDAAMFDGGFTPINAMAKALVYSNSEHDTKVDAILPDYKSMADEDLDHIELGIKKYQIKEKQSRDKKEEALRGAFLKLIRGVRGDAATEGVTRFLTSAVTEDEYRDMLVRFVKEPNFVVENVKKIYNEKYGDKV